MLYHSGWWFLSLHCNATAVIKSHVLANVLNLNVRSIAVPASFGIHFPPLLLLLPWVVAVVVVVVVVVVRRGARSLASCESGENGKGKGEDEDWGGCGCGGDEEEGGRMVVEEEEVDE
jgi:hypothetical protein